MKNKNKGITLIALIITIIVLLILAVVTINAVNEGSIFVHAENAANAYVEEAEKEQIKLALAEWNMEKYYGTEKTFLSHMQDKLAEIVNLSSDVTESQGVLTVKTRRGNIYKVTENGTITKVASSEDDSRQTQGEGGGEQTPVVAKSWSYNSDTGKYTNGTTEYLFGDTLTNEQVLAALGIQNNTGTYEGTWTVIGLENEKLKLISTDVLNEKVQLGAEDPKAKEAIPADDESNVPNTKKLERAIYSYNHAVDTLNNSAVDQTGISTARSVTIDDINELKGYTPKASDNGYGSEWKFYWNENKIFYKVKANSNSEWSEGQQWGDYSGLTSFYGPNQIIDKDNPISEDEQTVTYRYNKYNYTISTSNTDNYNIIYPGNSYMVSSLCAWKTTISTTGVWTFEFDIMNVGSTWVQPYKMFISTLTTASAYSPCYNIRAIVHI